MDNVCNCRLFSIPCKAFFKFWKVLSIMWIQQHLQMQWMRLLRVRIPLSKKHLLLQAFVKHVVEHLGLRKEAQKRGLGSRIDI